MQNGAEPNKTSNVFQVFDEKFPGRLMGLEIVAPNMEDGWDLHFIADTNLYEIFLQKHLEDSV